MGVQLSAAASVSQEALPQGSSTQRSGQIKDRWLFHATCCMSFQLPALIMLFMILNQAFIYLNYWRTSEKLNVNWRTLLKASTPNCLYKKAGSPWVTKIYLGVCVRACVVQLWVLASVAPVATARQQPFPRDELIPHDAHDVLLQCVTLNCDCNLLNESVYLTHEIRSNETLMVPVGTLL